MNIVGVILRREINMKRSEITCGIDKLELVAMDEKIVRYPSSNEMMDKINEIIELLNCMARSGNGLF